jgi:hypothetical protein
MVDGWALFFGWSELAVLLLVLGYFVLWRRG